MNLFKTLRWYIRLYKVRRSGNYPINSSHIWRVAKFMSKDVTHAIEERQENDFYATDPKALEVGLIRKQ